MIASNPRPVPSGAPSWVTAELIAQTVETWQAYYVESLTDQDALEILLAVSRLFDNLGE